jgi:hypothetical protein
MGRCKSGDAMGRISRWAVKGSAAPDRGGVVVMQGAIGADGLIDGWSLSSIELDR